MRVMCAMSGGVDSSVAALLLKEAGHDVVGVTMKLWGGDSDTGCCSVSDVDDARRVAQQLDIDHLVFNFGDEFDEHVVDPYVAAHAAGITPNPCIECNRTVKFARLAERADLLGFDAIATGHHARVGRTADGRFTIERGADRAKDQSYVVHMLDQEQLARTMFPVGDLQKSEVRAARRRASTCVPPTSPTARTCASSCRPAAAARRSSAIGSRSTGRRSSTPRATDSARSTRSSSSRSASARASACPAVDRSGTSSTSTSPRAMVVVGDDTDLLRPGLDVHDVTWVDGAVASRRDVLVQCSAHGDPRATIRPIATEKCRNRARRTIRAFSVVGAVGAIRVVWDEPQRRIAPGQSVVFYDLDDTRVLGGGIAG